MYASTRKPGGLATAFVTSDSEVELPERFKRLKDSIKPKNVEESWNRLITAFEAEIEDIRSQGSNIVPQIDFSEIQANNGKLPTEKIAEIKKRGCVVIRNVVNPELALQYKKDVKEYISRNRNQIIGFPENNPQVWEVYWSKSQIAARSHPNFNMVANAMNQLWHAHEGTDIDLTINVTYCDRLRIRQPKDESFTLAEHVDGGSLERWEDPEYRRCYENILNGEWEKHDPFDATHRVDAKMDLYNCNGGCSMFRTFQGWMSLSDVKSGGGTLRVCPLLKLTSAYIILRPFLPDLADSTSMGGALPGIVQQFTAKYHSHILKTTVSLPKVAPGDCVFWHCDGVHAVDSVCNNETDSSVFYIPATPHCARNLQYIERQKIAFENGTSAPDFPLNNCEEGLEDRATEADLTELGKLGMGFKKFQ